MAGRARPHLRVLHRRLLVRLSHDATESTGRRSAIVVAPHPDDETLGCGATIARKVQAGAAVRVVIVGDAADSTRRAECREACRRLGLDDEALTFLGLPDGGLADCSEEVTRALGPLLRHVSPDEVLSPCSVDAHPDHRAVARVVEALHREHTSSWRLLEYPIWFWNRWAWVERETPRGRQWAQLLWRPAVHGIRARREVVRTGEFGGRKRYALSAHATQVGDTSDQGSRALLDPQWLEMFLGNEELFFRYEESHGRHG